MKYLLLISLLLISCQKIMESEDIEIIDSSDTNEIDSTFEYSKDAEVVGNYQFVNLHDFSENIGFNVLRNSGYGSSNDNFQVLIYTSNINSAYKDSSHEAEKRYIDQYNYFVNGIKVQTGLNSAATDNALEFNEKDTITFEIFEEDTLVFQHIYYGVDESEYTVNLVFDESSLGRDSVEFECQFTQTEKTNDKHSFFISGYAYGPWGYSLNSSIPSSINTTKLYKFRPDSEIVECVLESELHSFSKQNISVSYGEIFGDKYEIIR